MRRRPALVALAPAALSLSPGLARARPQPIRLIIPSFIAAPCAAALVRLAGCVPRGQRTRAGFDIMTTRPGQAAAMLRAEHQRWAPILPGLNLRLD
jgi:hypothetical protein